jgi:hypothetical protein
MDAEASQQTRIDLEPGSEWRFELENDEDIAVRVSLTSVLLTPISRMGQYMQVIGAWNKGS